MARLVNAARQEIRIIRALIVAGLLFVPAFLIVYFQPDNRGNPWLFGLLTASVLFKLARLFHEWYHYWNVRPPVTPSVTRTWTVDVLTTYCPGEPHEMVVNTLRAILAIRYPHTTYLCDEANDAYLATICSELGVRYVTRTEKKHAKAGNINHALQQATGEICLILDPDHVPVPDFLNEVLPYFEDESVGFVQCVQAYSNYKESVVAYGAAEQTYSFYGPMMTCMGQYGTAQAIGANCTFRRAALDSIGGHAPGLSEDMHTAMRLHAKHWTSVYVPKPLSYGLVPATLSSYYKQQLKWARGTFDLLVTTYPALFKGFTWRQRLHYGTLPLYYLLGLVQLIDLALPVLSLIWMELPLRLDLLLFSAIYLPLLVTGFLIRQFAQRWLTEQHEAGFHVIGGILSSGTWWIYVLGLIYTIFRIEVPYLPTPKKDQPRNNLILCLPNLLVALGTLVTIGYSVYFFGRYAFGNVYMQMMIGFGLVNVFILGSNVLIGQEKLLLSLGAWLRKTRVNRQFGAAVRHAIWKRRYGLYSWVRSSTAWLFGGLIGLTMAINSYIYRQHKGPLPSTAMQYASAQPFYMEPGTEKPVTDSASLDLYIHPQHLSWSSTADALVDSPKWTGGGLVLPLLYLEPTVDQPVSDKAVQTFLRQIREAQYELALARFAQQVKAYQRPVLVSFAPYFDDTSRSWGTDQPATLIEYRKTWHYLVQYFRDRQIINVSWVWCPGKPATLSYVYPNAADVDWIGTSVIDTPTEQDQHSHSFAALFQGTHNALRFHPDYDVRQKPVLITRLYTTRKFNKRQWTADAMEAIHDRYSEVKGVVFNGE